MNFLDDKLIVIMNEIDDLFLKELGERPLNEDEKGTKLGLFDVGQMLYLIEKEKNLDFQILGSYLYYLQYCFFKLARSYLKNKEENSDVYRQLIGKKSHNPFDYFIKFGFFCWLFMPKEIQKTIFDEKRYDLFWDQLYHFWNEWEIDVDKDEFEDLKSIISKSKTKNIFLKAAGSNFLLKGRKTAKLKGRPTKISQEILIKFADMLDKNRANKKYTLEQLLKMAAGEKMDPTTIRNWLRNRMPLLQKSKNSIEELTKENILSMWKESQKAKNR